MVAPVAFLLDVDNTLLDNDRVKARLQEEIRSFAGEEVDRRFWELYEEVRADLDAVSIPVTLERLREEAKDSAATDELARRLFNIPFASFVYPAAVELLGWLRERGVPVILSDGDPWFQAKKITDAGLGAAVNGNVLIFLHKEKHIEDIQCWYPAARYLAVDDKARLLSLLKDGFGERVTTIWIRQGHYAGDDLASEQALPDYCVDDLAGVRAAVEEALALLV